MLAAVNYSNPVLWAVIVGWILTVVLHEFAHGLIGYLGGDYTIRERGGLTLNPLQYIHPVTSIVMPALFVLMGGIPLPGGATYVRTDLLRNRFWASLVSFAGPATNFILFLAMALPFHPALHWVTLSDEPSAWTNFQLFLGASALLQLLSVFLNLLPIPPLDGFGIIAPFLPADLRTSLRKPQTFLIGIFAIYLLMQSHAAQVFLDHALFNCLNRLGFDGDAQDFFRMSFNRVFFSSAE